MDKLERMRLELEAKSTEELERLRASGTLGPDEARMVNSIVGLRKSSSEAEYARVVLAATDTIASETARLATATEQLGG